MAANKREGTDFSTVTGGGVRGEKISRYNNAPVVFTLDGTAYKKINKGRFHPLWLTYPHEGVSLFGFFRY